MPTLNAANNEIAMETLEISDEAEPGRALSGGDAHTMATECASILRHCPVAKTRVRADSFGGASRTYSLAASGRTAGIRLRAGRDPGKTWAGRPRRRLAVGRAGSMPEASSD